MRVFADASFIVALYLESRFSRVARGIVRQDSPLLLLTPITRLEVIGALARENDPYGLARFREELSVGSAIRVADVASWSEALRLSEAWLERAAKRLKTGATDTLVVSLASLGGATHFLSFDQGSHQRVVALAAGMTVLPGPSKAEKALARSL